MTLATEGTQESTEILLKGTQISQIAQIFKSPADMKEGIARRPEGESQIKEMSLIDRLREFLETEARSGSMDPGCVTPEYVYRMWGGSVAIDEIATGLDELKKQGVFGL